MCIAIRSKADLGGRQVLHLSVRVAAPVHAHDDGPFKAWDSPAYRSSLYAVEIAKAPMPVGILYANFLEVDVEVGWWIDSEWRGKKLGRPVVIAFAKLLTLKYPTFAGSVRARISTHAGQYDGASRTLLAEFKRHFGGYIAAN